MGKIEQFEDFEVWQKAVATAGDILKLTNKSPLKNDYSIKDQIRRSAFSISSNIAEGYEHDNNKNFIRFLLYAKGSAGELRSQLYILHNTGMIDTPYYQTMRIELLSLSKQIHSLITYLRSTDDK